MFKIGDIVRLKSGGPAMTAQKVDGGKATCIWFKDDRLKTAIFRKDTIELVNPIVKADKDATNKDDNVPVVKASAASAKTEDKSDKVKVAKVKKSTTASVGAEDKNSD